VSWYSNAYDSGLFKPAIVAHILPQAVSVSMPACISASAVARGSNTYQARAVNTYQARAVKPDAVNPAMALRFAIEGQWRRVTDLERSTTRPT
jgi:hypothetical protein